MQYEGHIANGVVVVHGKFDLPEGTRVMVVPVAKNRLLPGAKPESLLKMAGSIPAADCMEMEKAINEACGQVNINAW